MGEYCELVGHTEGIGTIRRAPEPVGHCSQSDPDVAKQGSGKRDQCGAQLSAQAWLHPNPKLQGSRCLPGI